MKIGEISKFGVMLMAALGGVAVTPGTARALSCAINTVSAPYADDTGVPTDTLLWGYPQSYAQLRAPSGELVATDERRLPIAVANGVSGTLPVQVPRELLEPNATYTIEVDYEREPASPQRIVFTTGAGPASGAPAPPVLLSSERYVGAGYFSVTRGLQLSFEADGILIGDTGQLGDISTIDALFEQGDILFEARRVEDDPPTIQWASREDSVWAGVSDCGGWPRGAGDSASGRFGVLDLAGNFSGWARVALELPPLAEAEAAVATDREARRNLNVQQGRPSACSLGVPGAAGPGTSGQGRAGLLALALGFVVTGARRARRWRG